MAPNARKRKSPEPDAYDGPAYQGDEAQTPLGSPPKKRLRITQNQKQALIDNLQLESMLFPPKITYFFNP